MASGASTVTTYTYDKLDRLASVTNAEGTTSYGYNKVGSRTSVVYPNGTSQTYQYDPLNRLVKLETFNASGSLVASYSYTLDPYRCVRFSDY